MTVRCKFRCQSVMKMLNWQGKHVYEAGFSAVTDGSPEDQAFFDATPSGELKIGTYLPDVFEVGATYYVDLQPAPPANEPREFAAGRVTPEDVQGKLKG